jgi:hypothetical protein
METLGLDAVVISFSNSKWPKVTKLHTAYTKITFRFSNAQLHVVLINLVKAGSLKSFWIAFSLNKDYIK